MIKEFKYQETAELPDSQERPHLTSCYWCKQPTAAYIKSVHGIEVQCLNESCEARPLVGFCRGYRTHEKAAQVWNSAVIMRTHTEKKATGDIRNWKLDKVMVDKDELRSIFKEAMVDPETWNRYFKGEPYLDF